MKSRCHPVGSLSGLLSGWVGVRAFIVISAAATQPAITAPLAQSARMPMRTERTDVGMPTTGPSRSLTIILTDADAAPEAELSHDAPLATLSRVPHNMGAATPAPYVRIALAPPEPAQSQQAAEQQVGLAPVVTRPPQMAKPRPMLSTWLALRGSVGKASLASSGQLGGSQAGARLTVPVKSLSAQTKLGLSARATTALGPSRGKEAALGITVRREGAMPFELGVERRVGLDKAGRNAFALVAATGIYDRPILEGMTLNGYVQAGIVGARRRDAFVDGAVSLDQQIFSKPSLNFSVGAGAWGAVQPGLSRFDIGPVATLRVSGPAGPVRVSGAWRFRVAGKAKPGSGPAITIGTDF